MIKINKKYKYEKSDDEDDIRRKENNKLREKQLIKAKINAMEIEKKLIEKNNNVDNKNKELENSEENNSEDEEIKKLNEKYPENSDIESVNYSVQTYKTEKTNSLMNTNDVVSSKMDGNYNIEFTESEDPLDKFFKENESKIKQEKFTEKDFKGKYFGVSFDKKEYDDNMENKFLDEYSDKEMDSHIISLNKRIPIIKEDFIEKKNKFENKKRIKINKDDKNNEINKNIYIESKQIKNMTEEQVNKFRKEMSDIKVRGIDVPKPIFNWYQCGFSDKILDYLNYKLKFKNPFPIQCQGIPIVLTGRDCIGIAETGSGKTLTYILPLIRHIYSQEKLKKGDGPIGLIIVPTRELGMQIYNASKQFFKLVNIKSLAIYGGNDSQNQISKLKKGVEVLITTPARLIDVLTLKGKITNLKRVSFITLDECDRLFDFGFEPQITKILDGTNKNRQIVLFSATFPKNVEILAKRILNNPIEIVVGNRGQVNRNINQKIAVLKKEEKFHFLLKILGENQIIGRILIFLNKKKSADDLYKNLKINFYKPFLLHSDQDNEDRENTLKEFIEKNNSILITTSIFSRGLDINDINLIINYDCPEYKEDYIHRVGRTGRAGKRGTSITLLAEEDDKFSEEIIQALQISNIEVSEELYQLYNKFKDKLIKGETKRIKNKNLFSSGYQFNIKEQEKLIMAKNDLQKKFGFLTNDDNTNTNNISDKDYGRTEKLNLDILKDYKTKEQIRKAAFNAAKEAIINGCTQEQILLEAQKAIKDYLYGNYNTKNNLKESIKYDINSNKMVKEFKLINYPEITKNKITNKIFLKKVSEFTNCYISARGVDSNKYKELNQKPLHLYIIGETKEDVKFAYHELKNICEESANKFFDKV